MTDKKNATSETIEELADRTCKTFEDFKKLCNQGLRRSWITESCAKEVRENLFWLINDYRMDLDSFMRMEPKKCKKFLQQMLSWRDGYDDTALMNDLLWYHHKPFFVIDPISELTWVDVIKMFIKYDRIDLADLLIPQYEENHSHRDISDYSYSWDEEWISPKWCSPFLQMCSSLDFGTEERHLSDSEKSLIVELVADQLTRTASDLDGYLRTTKAFVEVYDGFFDISAEKIWDYTREKYEWLFLELIEDDLDECYDKQHWRKEHILEYDCNNLYHYVHDHYPTDSLSEKSEEFQKQLIRIYDLFFWLDTHAYMHGRQVEGVDYIDDDVVELLAKEGYLFENNRSHRDEEEVKENLINKGFTAEEIERFKSLSRTS